MPITPTVINGKDFYWYAVRESWNEERRLKVLSRRMSTEEEAQGYADFRELQVKKPNAYHKYHAILIRDVD